MAARALVPIVSVVLLAVAYILSVLSQDTQAREPKLVDAVRSEPAPAAVHSAPPPTAVRSEPAPAATRSEPAPSSVPPPTAVRSAPAASTCGFGANQSKAVLFLGFAKPFDSKERTSGYLGERQVATSIASAMQSHGYTTEFLGGGKVGLDGNLENEAGAARLPSMDFRRFHLVITNGFHALARAPTSHRDKTPVWHAVSDNRLELCRVRSLTHYGRVAQLVTFPTGERPLLAQYITPFNDKCGMNTHIGFHIVPPSPPPPAARGKRGLLWGKRYRYFAAAAGFQETVNLLLSKGFELHATCTTKCGKCKAKGPEVRALARKGGSRVRGPSNWPERCLMCECRLPAGVKNHGKVSPAQFSELLAQSAFLLGFGTPPLGPSPLEAMASGAAYLNPVVGEHRTSEFPKPVGPDAAYGVGGLGDCVGGVANSSLITPDGKDRTLGHWSTQHDALALYGPPYVYNVDTSQPETVLAAAEAAVGNRFDSFVPKEFRWESHRERVCSMLSEGHVCKPGALKDNAR